METSPDGVILVLRGHGHWDNMFRYASGATVRSMWKDGLGPLTFVLLAGGRAEFSPAGHLLYLPAGRPRNWGKIAPDKAISIWQIENGVKWRQEVSPLIPVYAD